MIIEINKNPFEVLNEIWPLLDKYSLPLIIRVNLTKSNKTERKR